MTYSTSALGGDASGLARDTQANALNRVAWGAIFAGSALALVVQLLLLLLGLGIGLAGADSGADGPSTSTLSVGAVIWWAVSGILAAAVGGFLAGRLSGKPIASTSGYHGLVSWAVTTLVVLFLMTSAVGGVLGGAFGAVTGALGGAGHMVGGAVQTIAPSLPQAGSLLPDIEGQLKAASGGQDPAQLRETAVNAIKAALTGDAAQRQQAVDRAADALAKAQNIPPDQAKAQVQRYQEQYTQAVAAAKAKAAQVARGAAKVTSEAALLTFVALLIGAVAAFFGGRFCTTRVSRFDLLDRAP